MLFDFNNLKNTAENFALIILLGFMVYEKLINKIKNKDYNNLTLFLKKNEQIQEKLTEIRVILGADRVKLFQFHNGDHYVYGDSALKCSITHISLKSGVAYPQQALSCYSNVTLSNINEYIDPMLKTGEFFKKVEELNDDDWKKVKILNGTKTILIKKIGTDPFIGGFVIISWHEDIQKPTKEQIILIDKILDSVSIILRSKNK
ncbi:MAG: hypothetical protein EBU90_06510 [Proteobacteria bacterium]|nr:hypothetical protein [Pseudomonadota bacterium]